MRPRRFTRCCCGSSSAMASATAGPISGRRPDLSLVLFGLVVLLNPAWRAIPALAGALVASLVILPIYFAILLRKLTNAIARAEEASRAKSHFLATMSHELRTPLNAIIGMSELLGTTRLDAEQRDMTATVRTAAGSLLGLVDQVLDLAKIEERRFAVEIEPFDLHDSLARLRSAAWPPGRGQRARPAPAPRSRDTVAAARCAAPAAPGAGQPGRQRDQVHRPRRGDHPRRAPLRRGWRDGLAALVRRRHGRRLVARGTSPGLFERFARSDDSVRRGISGSGLGLNITRELAQLMGGTVGLTSVLGQGSTFWLELPLTAECPHRPGRAARRPGGRPRRPGRGRGTGGTRRSGFGCEPRGASPRPSRRRSCCAMRGAARRSR